MSRLVAVELRRYLSRRLVRLAGGLAVLAIVIAGVVTLVRSHPFDEATATARAAQERAKLVQLCISGHFGPPDAALPEGVTREQFCSNPGYLSVEVRDPRFHLSRMDDGLKGTAVPLVLVSFVLAGSFIGAEWHAGTITTLLTWEPRRVRVLLAKAAVAMSVAFAAAVFIQALLLAALAPAAVLRGTTEGVNRAWVASVGLVVLRSGVLAAVAAAIAFAVAATARNTAAAMGVAFGYLVIFEQLLAGLRPGWRSWFFTWNAVVFMTGHRVTDAIPRSVVEATVLLVLSVASLLLIASLVFRTRDVT